MNSRQRVNAVLSGRLPDRIPTDLHDFQVCAAMLGRPFDEVFRSGELMAESQIAGWKRFGHDMILLENGTAANAEALGTEVDYDHDRSPVAHRGPLGSSLDEVGKLKIPDPQTTPPWCELVKATRLIRTQVGDQAFLIARTDQGPFSLASMLRGMESFLCDIALGQSEEKLHRVLQFATDAILIYACAMYEAGGDMVSIGDSIAGPDMCHPDTYRKFAWPYEKQLTDRLHAKGIRIANHICGNATSIVPDMVASGADILELDYKIDCDQVKRQTQGKTTVLGILEPARFVFGDEQEIRALSLEAMRVLGPGGGFVLGPGCALPGDSRPELIDAMLETGRRHGTYASDGSLPDLP